MLAADLQMFCRIAIILMFATAFIGKARDRTAFQEAVSDFRLLPERWSKKVVWGVLSLEVLIILLLAIGQAVLAIGFSLAVALLAIFSIALILVLRRKLQVRCNCFGSTEQRVSVYDVMRNILFILCSVTGIWAAFTPLHNPAISEIILMGLMATCFDVLITHLGEIVETLRKPFHAFSTP